MTDKEKLIDLIEQAYFCDIEHLADHLIANSVFVLTKPESKTMEFPRFRYNPEPQTNADRIRAMSDEELVEFLQHGCCPYIEDECTMKGCEECISDWLKQPVKDGGGDG